MAGLIFLPDRDGLDHLTPAPGLARLEGSGDQCLQALADRLVVRDKDEQAEAAALAAWRGALAVALLADAWAEDDFRLSILDMDEHTSPFAAMVMAARAPRERQEPLRLVVLEKGDERRTLGLVSRQHALQMAANPGSLSDFLPRRVVWYDRVLGKFQDPTLLMNERDRALLIRRLQLMHLEDKRLISFASDLAQASLQESQPIAAGQKEAMEELSLRVKASVCLEQEGFASLQVQEDHYRTGTVNAFLRCFTDQSAPADDGLGIQRIWLWQGVPFARSSSVVGLTGTHHPREQFIMEQLRSEIALLESDSTRWLRDAADRLRVWLSHLRESRAFLSAADVHLTELQFLLEQQGAQTQQTVALAWPWNEQSDAVQLLLRESLGPAFAFKGSPFSDVLARMPGAREVLGDRALQNSCRIGDDAYLPPLSEALAACLYQAPEGQGLVPEQLYLLPEVDGSVTATFLLRGEGEAALIRHYAPEEVITLPEIPTVAVWPCIPFEGNIWKAYYVYLHSTGIAVRTLCAGDWLTCAPVPGGGSVMQTAEYPACLTLYQEDKCLGALPNALPAARLQLTGHAVVALDVGATGTAAAIRFGDEIVPLQGDCLLRTLISGSDDAAYEEEFMPASAIAPVTSTCAAVSGEGSAVFADGRAYDPADISRVLTTTQTLLSGSLKWRPDEAARRGRKLFLHQTMLTASLVCLLQGASTVSWRLSLPDGTGRTTRKNWLDMAEELAGVIAQETGLELTPGLPPVSWAQESLALGMQLRESGLRGSFAAVDLGGGGTGIHLWLRTMPHPVAGSSIHGGLQTLLLGYLADCPEQLMEDFADCDQEALLRDIMAAVTQLQRAKTGLQQLDRAMLTLDLLFDRHAKDICAHMNLRCIQHRMTHLQSLLIEHFSAAMLSVGLALEQAGADSLLNHSLPEELPVCLSGRGSLLFASLPVQIKNGLARFIRLVMSPDHPVRSLLLYQSPDPKQDVCRGLCLMGGLSSEADDDVAIRDVRTGASFAALVMRFLLVMRSSYPMVCDCLHPGMFSAQNLLTPDGEDRVRRASAQHFGDGTDIPAALFATLSELRGKTN